MFSLNSVRVTETTVLHTASYLYLDPNYRRLQKY